MKLKGLTKLALSGVALAAVAATLGTSTYAWYVTNATATASGVQGAANAGGAGNVLVAQASTASSAVNSHGAFQQNITMDSSNFGLDGSTTAATTAAGLNPATPGTAALTSDDDVTEYSNAITASTQITSAKWLDKDGVEQGSGNYIKFDIWLLSTAKTTVNMSYSISNTTTEANVKKQLAYANTGLPTGVTQGSTFAVNIVDALRMAVVPSGASLAQTVSTGLFDVAGSASATTSTYGSFVTGGSANSYLNAVLGEDVITAGVTGVSESTIPLTVVANQEAKLTFYVWLEGTDLQCFDSCGNQSFAIDFSFTGI